MTALDIIVILLVGLGLFTGFRRGLVYAILSLGVWVVVVLALWALHGPVASGLTGMIGSTSGAYMLAFVLIFGLVLVGGKFAAARISKGVRNSFVGPADRVLGGGFGALKGLVYATLFFMAFSFIYDTIWGRSTARPDWVRQALTYPLVDGTAKTFVDLSEGQRAPAKAGERPANKAAPKSK
jgi:membrane protein required for colicin V production